MLVYACVRRAHVCDTCEHTPGTNRDLDAISFLFNQKTNDFCLTTGFLFLSFVLQEKYPWNMYCSTLLCAMVMQLVRHYKHRVMHTHFTEP